MDEDENKGFLSNLIGERNAAALGSAFKAYGSLLKGDLQGFKQHAQEHGKHDREVASEYLEGVKTRREEGQAFKQELRDNLFSGDLSGAVTTYKDRINEAVGKLKGENIELTSQVENPLQQQDCEQETPQKGTDKEISAAMAAEKAAIMNQAVGQLRTFGGGPMQEGCNQTLPAPCVDAPAPQAVGGRATGGI